QLLLAGILAGSVLLLLFFAPWQIATLGVAARAAVLGRPLKIGAALGGGLRRLPAVLGVYALEVVLIALLSGVFSAAVILLSLGPGSALGGNGSSSSTEAVAAAVIVVFVGAALFYVGLIYFSVRLALAPYAAATERIGSASAIGRSWR